MTITKERVEESRKWIQRHGWLEESAPFVTDLLAILDDYAPRVSEADILETAMRIRFPAEEKAGTITESLTALLRSLGVSVESGEEGDKC